MSELKIEERKLIKKIMLQDECPPEKINTHIDNMDRILNNDYHTNHRGKYDRYWDYLCSYDADCMVYDYVASDIVDKP